MCCIRFAFVVLGFESFLCSVEAGRSKVALRVSTVVRSAIVGLGLSQLGSLASTTLVGEMWYEASGEFAWLEVISLCHVYVFVSQSGARCFKILLEYNIGLELCLISFSYSLVPGCP